MTLHRNAWNEHLTAEIQQDAAKAHQEMEGWRDYAEAQSDKRERRHAHYQIEVFMRRSAEESLRARRTLMRLIGYFD